MSKFRLLRTEDIIQQERIQRLTTEKNAAETHLKLLQAQIEPHFLFNTLSNILSLLETDADKGKTMLVNLIQYLRATLSKIRTDDYTLGLEIEMIRAFLNLYKVRMGDRLTYQIDIPDHLKQIPFPPMLIQPLVENAIQHGLEPKIEGGDVLIRGEQTIGSLRLEISDTGIGLYEGQKKGLGISKTRERIESIYGDRGHFFLTENKPSGVKVIIEVPYEQNKSHNSR